MKFLVKLKRKESQLKTINTENQKLMNLDFITSFIIKDEKTVSLNNIYST